MNENLENKLIERFPTFYKPNNYGTNQEKFCFECDDYLFDLIWNTSIKIENILQKYPIEYQLMFSVIQVKTKFNSFCFYVSNFKNDLLDNSIIKRIYLEINEIIRKTESDGRILNERQCS